MRINTKIDDQLHRALNVHRATVGLPLRDVLERALRHYLDYGVAPEPAAQTTRPTNSGRSS